MGFPDERNPVDKLAEEFAARIRAGEQPAIDHYIEAYPEWSEQIQNLFPLIRQVEQAKSESDLLGPLDAAHTFSKSAPTPHLTWDSPPDPTTNQPTEKSAKLDERIGQTIGRYRILKRLGTGGFGCVYAAHDDQLERQVAIKLPNADRQLPLSVNQMVREAQLAAQLQHPGIVPVYDVGQTDQGSVYIVSRLIDGESLAERMRRDRLAPDKSASIIRRVAEALHYAHAQGFVHRDIKPDNILLDKRDQPYVADFGIALTDVDVLDSIRQAGTPCYMSPEQARGEGHLLDGRSDVFSLGVVFYELLTGVLPFQGKTVGDIVQRILHSEPRPIRQLDALIPTSLEWMCLRMLSKRAKERYQTAFDLAADLKVYLESADSGQSDRDVFQALSPDRLEPSSATGILPKGLLAFDQSDADFFITLLPGPYDRTGMPQCIRFWKHKIEQRDAVDTFRVGVLYGPSGCGKSSLMHAGILPRLSTAIHSISISAQPGGLCDALCHLLKQQFPANTANDNLQECFSWIRRRWVPESNRKVVLVIDQFEQFLHGASSTEINQLAAAMRHCDGEHVQAILLVRVDFWLDLIRFFRNLEPSDLDSSNSRLADLFDTQHARKVLAAFGRAFGKLPPVGEALSNDQNQFLDTAIDQLQENDQVIPVRLALFAEMVKHRAWTSQTLGQLGGIHGVGVEFLEETLGSKSRSPQLRRHRGACRDVLAALLPDSHSDLKGAVRSEIDLRQVAGYEDQADEFQAVLRWLDSELRLITPVAQVEHSEPRETSRRYYQLAHDYIVPALREWLTLQQKQSWRGRARLTLAESSDFWARKPAAELLPSTFDFLRIRLGVPRTCWTSAEANMMKAAKQRFIRRALLWTTATAMIAFGAALLFHRHRLQRAVDLTNGLLTTEIQQLPSAIQRIAPYFNLAEPQLQTVSRKNRDAHLRATVALIAHGHDRSDVLTNYLLDASAQEFKVITNIVQPSQGVLDADRLWAVLNNVQQAEASRFRAACGLTLLASPDSDSMRATHAKVAAFDELIARQLIVHANDAFWREALLPIQSELVHTLQQLSLDDAWRADQRMVAAELAARFADTARDMTRVLLNTSRDHLAVVMPHLMTFAERDTLIDHLVLADSDRYGPHQRALAHLALLGLGETKRAMTALDVDDDPSTRSHFISLISSLGIPTKVVAEELEKSNDAERRRGLVLCLAELGNQMEVGQRNEWLHKIADWRREAHDLGVRAACEYLLRTWDNDWQIDEWQEREPQRDAVVTAERVAYSNRSERHSDNTDSRDKNWYVNSVGQTLAIVQAGQFEMGSPESERYHLSTETLRRQVMNRTLAMGWKCITQRDYARYLSTIGQPSQPRNARTAAMPAAGVTWYQAAAYCNWLSKQDGIDPEQWCFQPNSSGQFAAGMRVVPDCLTKKGYRLPTEAEWEFICRCARPPVVSRYYGSSDKLLGEYAWFQENTQKVMPCGLRKPNDWGLFDMHGNVWEWTITPKGGAGDDIVMNVQDGDELKLQGGAFVTAVEYVRSACSYLEAAQNSTRAYGFRVVRTIDAR